MNYVLIVFGLIVAYISTLLVFGTISAIRSNNLLRLKNQHAKL